MISTRFVSAFAAAAMASMALADGTPTSSSSSILSLTTPTASVAANAMTDIGCFNSSLPMEDHGYYLYQSPGNCQLVCLLLQKPVLGLSDGTNCWCGDLIPPANSQTNNGSCDTDCSGTDKVKCGGPHMLWISLTGLTKNRISNYVPSSSSIAPSSTKAPVAQSTQQGETVIVTATDSAVPKKSDNGPNKAGIAAGVVVGVVVLIAIIVGVVLFLRHKKRKEAEEEYRRRSAANPFFSGKPHTSNSSMTDSRLDPEFMNRRASNGSIADNEDYSRRILKVTNA